MANTVLIDNFLDTCRNANMLSSVSPSTKTSACFICGEEFPLADLTSHEKACLDYIKSNDHTDGSRSADNSSNSSYPSVYNPSLSARSSSSGASSDLGEKKHSRCYICGTDVPNYLSSIHEKNCKKSWESGLLNSICTPARKSKSKSDLSSLSRSGSRDNLLNTSADSYSSPNLAKSKSSTNIQHEVEIDLQNKENRPRHLKTISQRKPILGDTKSKSTTNLAKTKSNSTRSLSSTSGSSFSTSSQDVRRASDIKGKKKSDPQYVICQICGKLYSVHSISIHQRTCERTYKKQKDVGTNVEYKIKSKSLADLSKHSTPKRPSTANARIKDNTPVKTPTRPSTAGRNSKLKKDSTLSKSTGNLAPTYVRQLLVKKDIVDAGTTPSNEVDATSSSSEVDVSKLSPGLKKCYLCGQLYGTRSLPIHEKQCLKKWERSLEEERKKKKKTAPKKDIQIMTFGRSKDENLEGDDITEEQQENEAPVGKSLTPSKLFGVPSPLKSRETDSHIENSPSKTLTNGDVKKGLQEAKFTTKPKFVACVYCSKQYGGHSIAIHEKNCRDKTKIENETRERLNSSGKKSSKMTDSKKKLSKSVGDITLQDAYNSQNNDDMLRLIQCSECMRKFLKSDIEKHRLHCRVSVL